MKKNNEFAGDVHALKCCSLYYDLVELGRKRFEVRLGDRDYKEGDFVILAGWLKERKMFDGRTMGFMIGHVVDLEMIGMPGWVAFDLEDL